MSWLFYPECVKYVFCILVLIVWRNSDVGFTLTVKPESDGTAHPDFQLSDILAIWLECKCFLFSGFNSKSKDNIL